MRFQSDIESVLSEFSETIEYLYELRNVAKDITNEYYDGCKSDFLKDIGRSVDYASLRGPLSRVFEEDFFK